MRKFSLIFITTLSLTLNSHTQAATQAKQCQNLFDEELWQKALSACTVSAKAGEASSQSLLGEIYDNKKNSEKAAHWWKLAANAGYQPARNLLASKYYYGGSVFSSEEGWPQDLSKAFNIWHEDAEKGIATSQFMIGVMYHKGEGVAQNHAEAWFWLKLALQNKYKLATDVLIELSREISPEQKKLGMQKLVNYNNK